MAEDNVVDLYMFTSKVYNKFVNDGLTLLPTLRELVSLVSS
jgi:hypothetical protein